MISNEELENFLKNAADFAYLQVEGDGYHYQLTAVSDQFQDKSRLARQQWIYELVKDYILDGSIHALSMKTWTKLEWEKQRG